MSSKIFTGSISFDKKIIILKPISKLYPGTYTLKIFADSIQNYGGIRLDTDVVFNFTVAVSPNPCASQYILQSPIGDINNSAEIFQVLGIFKPQTKLP